MALSFRAETGNGNGHALGHSRLNMGLLQGSHCTEYIPHYWWNWTQSVMECPDRYALNVIRFFVVCCIGPHACKFANGAKNSTNKSNSCHKYILRMDRYNDRCNERREVEETQATEENT